MRLIDADNAIRALGVFSDMEHGNKHFLNGINSAKEIINECVTIDAVPVVRGEWKRGREFPTYPRVPFIGTAYYCSNCEGEAYWDTDYGQQLFSYCPNCGAKMDGGK